MTVKKVFLMFQCVNCIVLPISLCLIGIVFAVLIFALVKNRQSTGSHVVHFHSNLGLELIWTTLPFLIVVGLAAPSIIQFLHAHV